MTARFPFIRSRAAPPAVPAPGAIPPASVAAPVRAPAPLSANAASVAEAVDHLLAVLEQFLDNLPEASVATTDLTERPLALGNWRGMERRGPFAIAALKGGRVDAGVRFQFFAATPQEADNAVTTLQARLLAASDALFLAGFLRLTAAETSLAEHLPATNRWRKTATYRVLYEYHYRDQDGAESIIARIPIHSDLEAPGLLRETTVVTDAMVRWDNEEASTLEVGATTGTLIQIAGLAILAYLPAGWTGSAVTVARLDRRATGPPTPYASLAAFHAAVTDPVSPDRHAQVTFPSVAALLATFETMGDPLELGDWDDDGLPDLYQPGALAFDPPIQLKSGADLFQIIYQDPAFAAPGVVYLRVEGVMR